MLMHWIIMVTVALVAIDAVVMVVVARRALVRSVGMDAGSERIADLEKKLAELQRQHAVAIEVAKKERDKYRAMLRSAQGLWAEMTGVLCRIERGGSADDRRLWLDARHGMDELLGEQSPLTPVSGAVARRGSEDVERRRA